MKREAVAYVAVFAAAVSLGALGYAVVWGVDPAELGRPSPAPEAASPPSEVVKEMTRAWPRRRPPRIVLAPEPAGDDAKRADPMSRHETSWGDAAPAAAYSLPAEASALAPVTPPAPSIPGEDAAPVAAVSLHRTEPSVAIEPRLPIRPLTEPMLIPQAAGGPAAEAPVALPDPDPVGTIAPPEQGHVDAGPSVPVARAPAIEPPRTAPPIALRPALIVPRRPIRPRAPRPALSSVTIIYGVPPVPSGSPAIVNPGPLIIHVPQAPRR